MGARKSMLQNKPKNIPTTMVKSTLLKVSECERSYLANTEAIPYGSSKEAVGLVRCEAISSRSTRNDQREVYEPKRFQGLLGTAQRQKFSEAEQGAQKQIDPDAVEASGTV